MMQQRLFLFVILLHCLSFESKMLVYSLPVVDLVFLYSSEQSPQTTAISVATRLELAGDGKNFYSLEGSAINDTMLIVKTVQCVSYPSYPKSCGANSQSNFIFIRFLNSYKYFKGHIYSLSILWTPHKYVLRISEPNPCYQKTSSSFIFKEYKKEKFNLTCVLKPPYTLQVNRQEIRTHIHYLKQVLLELFSLVLVLFLYVVYVLYGVLLFIIDDVHN